MANFDIIDSIISSLDKIQSLERIKSGKTEIDIKALTKHIYDFTKEHSCCNTDALPELVIEGFDEEQIWQQLELQNESETLDLKFKTSNKTSRILSSKKKLTVPLSSIKPENEPVQIENDDFHEENESMCDDIESDNENEETKTILKRKHEKKQKSVVDDKFFKLEELTEYLTKEEKKEKQEEEDDESDESVDLFNDLSEEEEDNVEGKYMKYADFFDSPESENEHLNESKISNKDSEEERSDDKEDMSNEEEEEEEPLSKRVRFNLTNDSDETDSLENKANKEEQNDDEEYMEEDAEPKSTLEARQERLKMKIQELEQEIMSEKPWQLKGEVSGLHRPQNSLLEEFVEFDITKRPAPVITEETTIKLEDIIMRRIKDKAWDDVEKKFKPVETPLEYKKKLILDQEKSKESLSQIYEKEYLRQKKASNPDNEDDEKKEESSQLHNEIRHMMRSLISKLDALSHYHYTPKLAKPEIKIISNVPAINMEEVAPVATSDATLLAPEEVKAKPHGDLIGKSERTKTDMKRERRKKKLRQRAKQQAIEKKEKLKTLKPGISKKLKDKKEKEMLLKKVTKDRNVTKLNETTHKVAKSSTTFFTQLQDQIKSKKNTKTSKNKDKKTVSAVKLKL